MTVTKYKFSRDLHHDFASDLKKRVNDYFKENNLSRYGDYRMVVKSIFMLSLYFSPFLFMLISGTGNLIVLFACWFVMGLGKAGIGTAVMHDALHGVFSKNKIVNNIMGNTIHLLGANASLWKIQHNVLHHTYTNIEHADEDISPRFVMRFTPHQQRLFFHRFQHIYAWFFYGISTLTWVTFKDFVKVFDYNKKGLIKSKTEFRRIFVKIISWKLAYFGLFLVLPMILLPVSAGMVLLMFLTMHFVAGLFLTLVFQSAHVVPEAEFIIQEKENVEQNWSVHQLMTTTNFAPKNKILGWFIGGLNNQVEHHLFPNICHIHYRKIAEIVRQTASEYKMPYYCQKSFRRAVRNHFQLLRTLGSNDPVLHPAMANRSS